MDNNEAIEKLKAYLKCQKGQVKGIYVDCNNKRCDNCDLLYMQGTVGEHITSIELAIQALEKLKEYQQLEEQGKLVKLPCKVGDAVYAIGFNNKPIIYESVVLRILITKKEIVFNVKVDEFEINSQLKQSMFGKTVFLTRKEAEAKLKELRGGENG